MRVPLSRVGLPREEQQEEEDSGSRDRELRHPDGGTVRKQLRHRQLPPAGNSGRAGRERKPRASYAQPLRTRHSVRSSPYIIAGNQTSAAGGGSRAVSRRGRGPSGTTQLD